MAEVEQKSLFKLHPAAFFSLRFFPTCLTHGASWRATHMIMTLWSHIGPMAAPHHIHDSHDHGMMTIHDTNGAYGSPRYFCDGHGMRPRSSTAHICLHDHDRNPIWASACKPEGFWWEHFMLVYLSFFWHLPVRICLAQISRQRPSRNELPRNTGVVNNSFRSNHVEWC